MVYAGSKSMLKSNIPNTSARLRFNFSIIDFEIIHRNDVVLFVAHFEHDLRGYFRAVHYLKIDKWRASGFLTDKVYSKTTQVDWLFFGLHRGALPLFDIWAVARLIVANIRK